MQQKEGPASGALLCIEMLSTGTDRQAANNCQFLGMITASIA
jgi:hypothetical protein